MDPLAALFSAYINATNSLASNLADTILENHGSKLKTEMVTYQGIKIPFAYQFWRIQPQSVCHSYRQNIGAYSRCTLAAKSLFNEACQRLQQPQRQMARQSQLQNMYCTAAISYQPTIAAIGHGAEESPLQVARRECNQAIAQLLGNPDPAAQKRKERVCATYEQLKGP